MFDIVLGSFAGIAVLFVPIGIGLLLLFSFREVSSSISSLQSLLVSYLLGTFVIIISFIFLERFGMINLSSFTILILFIISFIGYFKSKSIFIFDENEKEFFSKFLLGIITIVVLQYVITIGIYSSFPNIDLFQRVHFHTGALSLAKYNVLNPFYADSYIPFQIIMLGLIKYVGIDPLLMEWILPLSLMPLKIIAVYIFVDKIASGNFQKFFIIGLTIILLGVSNPTNGTISQIGTFLLMSLLFNKTSDIEITKSIIMKIVLSFVFLVLSLFLLRNSIFLVIISLLSFMVLIIFSKEKNYKYFIIAVTIFLILAFHRAGLLYSFMAIFMYGFYSLFIHINNKLFFKIMKYLITFIIILLFIATIMILISQGKENDIFGLWTLFDYLLKPIVGKSMFNLMNDKDLAIGAGSYITLFELGRSLSFLLVVLLVSFLGYSLYKSYLLSNITQEKSDSIKKGVLLGCIGLLLILLILTGFPFIHRAYFLIIIVLSTAVTIFIEPIIRYNFYKNVLFYRVVLISIFIYMIIIFGESFGFSNETISFYLNKMYPLLFVIFMLAVFIGIKNWSKNKQIKGMLLILLLTIFFEKALVYSHFKKYAFFGQVSEKEQVFSHYNYKQLQVADKLSKKIDNIKTIIISDPKTMALIGSRTGNSPIASFSNLNTMLDETEKLLVALLNKIKKKDTDNQICQNSLYLLDSHASSTYNYVNTKLELKSGALALNTLGYNNALVPKDIEKKELEKKELEKKELEKKELEKKELEKYSFIIVINYDTLKWIDNPKSFLYFPQNGNYEDIINLNNNQVNEYIVNDTYIKELKCIKIR